MTYSFRIRVAASVPQGLKIEQSAIELRFRDHPEPSIATLKSLEPSGDRPIREATWLALTCHGFDDEQSAAHAAEECRARFMAVLAAKRIGFDFGDRTVGFGEITKAGLDWMEGQVGQRVINDRHGVVVFESAPPAKFGRMGPFHLLTTTTAEGLGDSFDRAIDLDVRLSPKEQVAYDLFAASFFSRNPDVRLLMLMTAIEALIDVEPVPPEVAAVVDEALEASAHHDLRDSDRKSLEGRLCELKNESIRRSVRRTVAQLGDRQYHGLAAQTFVDRCYRIRSTLLHRATDRPRLEEVDRHAAGLEVVVSDLLARDLKNP